MFGSMHDTVEHVLDLFTFFWCVFMMVCMVVASTLFVDGIRMNTVQKSFDHSKGDESTNINALEEFAVF